MPTAPLRPCRTCGQVGCQQHLRQAWAHAREVPRIRGRKLQELRRRLFQEHPLCVLCLAQGRTSVATIRDHIIPLGEVGRDEPNNTNAQALCGTCSDAKTQAEARRGQARVYPYGS